MRICRLQLLQESPYTTFGSALAMRGLYRGTDAKQRSALSRREPMRANVVVKSGASPALEEESLYSDPMIFQIRI
jgi:hypothetical protein